MPHVTMQDLASVFKEIHCGCQKLQPRELCTLSSLDVHLPVHRSVDGVVHPDNPEHMCVILVVVHNSVVASESVVVPESKMCRSIEVEISLIIRLDMHETFVHYYILFPAFVRDWVHMINK